MADISRLARLVNGVVRGLDLTENTLVLENVKLNLGGANEVTFAGSLTANRTITIPDANVDLGLINSALQDDLLGAANGIATLDSNGKVPLSQLPNSIVEYKGTWNASTNTPALANGAGNPDTAIGDVYRVVAAGTVDFGSGDITFAVGDYAILNDDKIWEKAQTSEVIAGLASLNGLIGDVELVAGQSINITDNNSTEITIAVLDGSIGTIQLNNQAVTSEKIANEAVGDAQLANGAVTTVKIADDAVVEAKIANEAVTSAKIQDAAISSAKLATDSVATDKIQDSAVTVDKLADDSVSTAKLQNLAVTAEKLANNAVSENKIVATSFGPSIVGGDGQKINVVFSSNLGLVGDFGAGNSILAGEGFDSQTPIALCVGADGKFYKAGSSELETADGKFNVAGILIARSEVEEDDFLDENGEPSVTLTGIVTMGDVPFNSLDIGKPVFLGTAGELTVTAPTDPGTAVVYLGIVLSEGSFLAVPAQVRGIN